MPKLSQSHMTNKNFIAKSKPCPSFTQLLLIQWQIYKEENNETRASPDRILTHIGGEKNKKGNFFIATSIKSNPT